MIVECPRSYISLFADAAHGNGIGSLFFHQSYGGANYLFPYFTQNLELSNHEVLKKIALECGLDEKETANILSSDRYAEAVRADEQEATERGIHGVPYFLVNGKYTASGAQPTEMLKEALKKILAEEKIDSLNGMVCGIDGCRISE